MPNVKTDVKSMASYIGAKNDCFKAKSTQIKLTHLSCNLKYREFLFLRSLRDTF